MKKLICIILSLVTCLGCVSALTACGADTTDKSTEYILNSFEEYNDVAKMRVNATMYGEFQVNEDEDFITDGKASMKIISTTTPQGTPYDYLATSLGVRIFHTDSGRYADKFKLIDKMDYISLDVYNAMDYDFDMYIHIRSENAWDNVYTSGATIAANQWTRVVFDINPYFFPDNCAYNKIYFYIAGLNQTEEDAVFYIDNLRIATYDSKSKAPDFEVKKGITRDGITLLGFDSMEDLKYIQLQGLAGDVESFAKVSHDKGINIWGDKGAYRMDLYSQNLDSGDHWYKEGYKINIASTVTEKARGQKSVDIDFYNPDTTVKYISIFGTAGTVTAERQVAVPAGGRATLSFDDEEVLESIDDMYISVSTWNYGKEKNTLYFSNLRYTI